MREQDFVGREAQARTILGNIESGNSSLIIGEAGMGKSALLDFIEPALQDLGTVIHASRVSPFGTLLREMFTGLWEAGLTPDRTNVAGVDWKAFGKANPSNDEKAAAILKLIEAAKDKIILVLDDASGITPTSRPWLEQFVEATIMIATVVPEALRKAGTKRFWKRFDEIRLERLSKAESAEMLEHLMTRFRVVADEPEVYRRRVLELGQGSPFELQRLVKYHSSQSLVKTRDLIGSSQNFVERDEKGVSLAPLLLIGGAFVIAGRYIARAQGDMDLYVIAGVGMALMIVFGPWLRSTVRARSA